MKCEICGTEKQISDYELYNYGDVEYFCPNAKNHYPKPKGNKFGDSI